MGFLEWFIHSYLFCQLDGVCCILLLISCSPCHLRFMSSPDQPGGEKIVVTLPAHGLVTSAPGFPASEITSMSGAEHLIPPMGLLAVKGWTRSVSFYIVMAACYENDELLQARIRSWCGNVMLWDFRELGTVIKCVFFVWGTWRRCEEA